MLWMTKIEIMDAIGANLSKIRKEQRHTQKEIAAKAGLDMNYYAKIERGESMPSLTTLEKIVRAFGVSSADILPF